MSKASSKSNSVSLSAKLSRLNFVLFEHLALKKYLSYLDCRDTSVLKRPGYGDRRNGSVVKNTWLLLQTQVQFPEPTLKSSRLLIATPAPENPAPPSGILGHPRVHSAHKDRQVHLHTYKIKTKREGALAKQSRSWEF